MPVGVSFVSFTPKRAGMGWGGCLVQILSMENKNAPLVVVGGGGGGGYNACIENNMSLGGPQILRTFHVLIFGD